MYLNILLLCGTLAVLVFSVMLYSLATFRRIRGPGAASYRHSAIVEVLWALVPVVILFGAAAPAVRMILSTESGSLPILAERLNSR